MKGKMKTRILAMLLSAAMVMNGSIPALASEMTPATSEEIGHKHTAECYIEEKTVVCGQEESVGHTHDDDCYTTIVTCGLDECVGHSHEETCYALAVASCGKEEHLHSEECNTEEFSCGREEHIHDDGCTTKTEALVCGQGETVGHTHGDSCNTRELTCNQDETAGHKHEDKCYTLTSTLICTIPEAEPTEQPIAEDTVEVLVCEVCRLEKCTCEKDVVVCKVCELEECTCTPTEEFVESVEYEDEEIIVTVKAVDENAIPANVILSVVPITALEEQYEEVEEQLMEKIDENQELLGFIAYDICFVNENGEKIEPYGQVQVFMEYKKAITPENTDKVEDAEITVMHFEEDVDTGEVTQIVDMSKENQLKTLETTCLNEVTKAEFATESFSLFTIIWTIENFEESRMTIHCVDTAGSYLTEQQYEIGIYAVDGITAIESIDKNISDYKFVRAYVATSADIYNEDKIEGIHSVRYNYNDKQWEFSASGYVCGKETLEEHKHTVECYEDAFEAFGENNLYFEYQIEMAGKVMRIPTADTSGINISLYNYNVGINWMKESKNSEFYFDVADGGSDAIAGQLGKYAVHGLTQNLVKYNLNSEKYPVLNESFVEGGNSNSLDYLFKAKNPTIKVYNGLSGLFQKDADGYYYYDSRINHAQYNADEGSIDIYNGALAHVKRAIDPANKDHGGQFLPFDNINNTASSHNMTVKDYKDEEQNVELYTYATDSSNNKGDMWFSMKIDAVFMQPKNGQLNGKDVVFQFSGDDDVWLFIDGIKVLDLGGIHGAQYGNINFATGDVIAGSTTTTIYECYVAAYEEAGKDLSDLDSKFVTRTINGVEKRVFKDFEPHTMNFFYFERGEGLSNCRVKFNLPVLPTEHVIVKKEIENYDANVANDVEFGFKMYTKPEGSAEYSPLVNHNYSFYEAGAEEATETRKTGTDGIFYLKHNERAVFENLSQGTDYYVEEVGVNGNQYGSVIIDASGVVDANDNTIAQGNIRSKELEVGRDSWVIFKNVCSNFQYLVIGKNILEEDVKYANPNAKYAFEVKIANEKYVGDYKVIPRTDYEEYESDIASLRTYLAEILPKNTESGTVQLAKDEVAVLLGNAYEKDSSITGFPAGTSFEVKEVLLDEKLYDVPVYEIGLGTADDARTTTTDGYNNSVSGKIKLDNNAYVNVTNALIYGDLIINKKLLTFNKTLGEATFVFDVVAKLDCSDEQEIYHDIYMMTFDKAGTDEIRVKNLPAGAIVTVKEVYSGASYEPVLAASETLEKVATISTTSDAIVEFVNTYVDGRLNSGSGLVNEFVYEETTQKWLSPQQVEALIIPEFEYVKPKDDETVEN